MAGCRTERLAANRSLVLLDVAHRSYDFGEPRCRNLRKRWTASPPVVARLVVLDRLPVLRIPLRHRRTRSQCENSRRGRRSRCAFACRTSLDTAGRVATLDSTDVRAPLGTVKADLAHDGAGIWALGFCQCKPSNGSTSRLRCRASAARRPWGHSLFLSERFDCGAERRAPGVIRNVVSD